MTAISPTVRSRHEKDPQWPSNRVKRAHHAFTSGDFDVYGYDVNGWDSRGRDRAGYAAADYVADPALDEMIYTLAPLLDGPTNPASLLRKTLPASGRIVDLICEFWPSATLRDDIRKIEEAEGPVCVARSVDQHGSIHVELSVVPEWPEEGRMNPRGLRFTFDRDVAIRAEDPVGTINFSVTTYDGDEFPDWTAVTDLRTVDDVGAAASLFVSGFRPDRMAYAISIEDGPDGGVVAATAISDADAEEGKAAGIVAGDFLFLQSAYSPLEALQIVGAERRLRTSALADMLERGIAVEMDQRADAPTFG